MSVLIWQKCLDYLQDELPSQQFNTWIRPLVAEGDRDELRLHAPNRFVLDWVNEKFYSRIMEILDQVTGNNPPKVTLVVSRSKPSAFRKTARKPTRPTNYGGNVGHGLSSSHENSTREPEPTSHTPQDFSQNRRNAERIQPHQPPIPENPVIQELDFAPFDENDVPVQPSGGFPFSELESSEPFATPKQEHQQPSRTRDMGHGEDVNPHSSEMDISQTFASGDNVSSSLPSSSLSDFDDISDFDKPISSSETHDESLLSSASSHSDPYLQTSDFQESHQDLPRQEGVHQKAHPGITQQEPHQHESQPQTPLTFDNEVEVPSVQRSAENLQNSMDRQRYDADQFFDSGGSVKFSIGSHTSSVMDAADKDSSSPILHPDDVLHELPDDLKSLSDHSPTSNTGQGVNSSNKKNANNENIKHQSYLNKSFTFDTFVEGKSNQLARAAAAQVAANAGRAYNPLFLYGGVGLGKTHLMHAVGNSIARKNPNSKVVYLHSERFVADMVKALQLNAINEFKRYYRSVDALLIDDIQFFAGKERSQEEFFHTFNALLEGDQQMILTCDRYPKEISGLEERLKSRFGWGLTVAVEPPELETRVAILMKKADQAKVDLPNDAAFFIAQKIRSNVRELEGALKRVIAQAHFTGNTITTPFIKESLKDLLALQDKQVSIENIQRTTAEYYKIKVSDLLSKRRSRSVARPRQIAMTLAKELTTHSLPEIGESFGGRDHTTVLHACRKVKELRDGNADIREDYNNLMRLLTT